MSVWSPMPAHRDPVPEPSDPGSTLSPASLFPALLLEHPQRRDPYAYRGALLNADVSGFTTMTEALSRHGREGSEELKRVLGSYFGHMVQLAEAHRGYVLDLAGDALSILFRDDIP